jgi:hypothetical protein
VGLTRSTRIWRPSRTIHNILRNDWHGAPAFSFLVDLAYFWVFQRWLVEEEDAAKRGFQMSTAFTTAIRSIPSSALPIIC